MKLIEERANVAFIKSPAQWATQNIADILDGVIFGAVYPADRSGQSYEDYLRLMLFLGDREKKLLRTMDLIQINMKGTYDGGFMLKDYYSGFDFEATIEGNKYAYSERY
jgi:hypothetical protein